MRALLPIIFMVTTSTIFAKGIYKWTDENGHVFYSDHPQPSAEEIVVKTNHKADPELEHRREKRDRLLGVFEEERDEEKKSNELAAQTKAEQKRECMEAMKKLEKYQTAGYLYKLDGNGERVILNDDDRAKALEMAQDSVDHWCG